MNFHLLYLSSLLVKCKCQICIMSKCVIRIAVKSWLNHPTPSIHSVFFSSLGFLFNFNMGMVVTITCKSISQGEIHMLDLCKLWPTIQTGDTVVIVSVVWQITSVKITKYNSNVYCLCILKFLQVIFPQFLDAECSALGASTALRTTC